jgi:hypothetical protein
MDFETYLKKKDIDAEAAAKALGKTKAYIHMLIAKSCTPSLHLAATIEHWTGGVVTMQSWLDWRLVKKSAKAV